jgi:anti-sigma B factor antagonist
MNQPESSVVLERQDYGDVTALRMHVQTLAAGETTDSLFEQAYAVIDTDGRSRVVLNLDGVVFLASLALGKLVRLLHKVRKAGGRIVLCKLSRNLEDVLRIAVPDVFLTYSDEQEAVRSFA